MENLKGKTILIGKEPEQGRLLVAVQVNGQYKMAYLGMPGCVPSCVSRCLPQQGMGHAKVEVGSDGSIKLTNMKAANVTYVNGAEIVSKHVSPEAKVELGKDCFAVDLKLVLSAASKVVASVTQNPAQGGAQAYGQPAGSAQVPTFNIAHLEVVWNNYHNGQKALREKQKRVNLIRTGCGICTMCAMLCIAFIGRIGYALTALGVLGTIYSFFGLKNDNSADAQEKLLETFQDHYVCPNPQCNKFLGGYSYKMMKKQYGMKCPYCKCNYVEK
jgi:hypothetical protein